MIDILNSKTVYIHKDTIIGKGVTIEPNVVIKENVILGDYCTIKSFSYLENCNIKNNAIIGPFAHIRAGTEVGEYGEIGNFVEVKNSRIGKKSKAKHLTYIGDTEIGTNSNIGAGTITCNYDGVAKEKTIIGNSVFVGSNSTLVAPLEIEDSVYIAAGSIINKGKIPSKSLAISRPGLVIKENWVK